jgi:hypothetical protein
MTNETDYFDGNELHDGEMTAEEETQDANDDPFLDFVNRLINSWTSEANNRYFPRDIDGAE